MFQVLLGVIVILFAWIFYQSRKSHSHWRDKGVPYKEPRAVVGSFWRLFTLRENKDQLYERIYKEAQQRDVNYYGFYEMLKPVLILRDPEVISRVLIKDFGHFVDHGYSISDTNDVDTSLFLLKGDKWRAVRHKMMPTFTTGKLRGMFSEMLNCTGALVKKIDSQPKDVDLLDVSTIYTMKVIGSCAFGMDVGNEDSEFRHYGKKVIEVSFWRYLRLMFIIVSPQLSKMLGVSIIPKDVADYFSRVIRDTFRYRKENNIIRNDFVQLLLQLKEKGSVEMQTKDPDDDYLKMDNHAPLKEPIKMTDRILISQAFTFLTAGFEGITVNIVFNLLELAQNERLQQKVRAELCSILEKHGSFTYDSLQEATFLSNCLDESLRMYPLVPTLMRMCNKRYELSPGLWIEPGDRLVVSVPAIHRDPAYFNQPDTYNPERFGTDHIRPCTYLPFGDGPRMCIAMRFALLEIKLGLAVILYNYKVTLSPKTKLPVVLDKKSFFTKPKDPVLFNLEKINRT